MPRAGDQSREEQRHEAHGGTPRGNISPCPPRRELDSLGACGNVGAVIPRDLNAAHWFVDRHVEEGRDGRLAIIYEGQRLTYGDVYAGANRVGNMLRRLGVTIEQRVGLLLPDGPEVVSSFWGALKVGDGPGPAVHRAHPGDAQGARPPAPRYARLLRSVRPARARDRAGGPHVLGRQAVLRLRPGQCAVLPVSHGRLDGPLPGPPRAGEGVR